MAGLDRNMLMLIRALAENRIQDAKKIAITCKIEQCIDKSARSIVREEIRDRVMGTFGRMTISVDITDKEGQSVIIR